MNQKRVQKVPGRRASPSCSTCRKRLAQQTSRSAPTACAALKSGFVYLSDLIKLVIEQLAFRYSLAVRVVAISGQRCRQVMTLVARKQQANVQLVIEAVAPAVVKSFAQQVSLPKHPGLRRVVSPGKRMRRGFGHNGGDDHVILLFTKHQRVATQPIAFWMFAEIIYYGRESPGQIKIVAIEVGHYLTGGALQALVQSMCLSAIFFAHPESKLVFVFANYLQTAVRAAAIDDDKFQRLVVLLEHGKDSLLQKRSLIEGRRND